MENNEIKQEGSIKLHFSPAEEKDWYMSLRRQLIKLLYMIEAEEEGTGNAELWFYGFMHELASSNELCGNKLTKVVVKIYGLYDGNHYKEMSHEQIKRQIMESRGIIDHILNDME